ncbi:hypothetical protein BKA83DRAFT_1436002 [Pisolithus microcarpus]|nr:hypothetical protein BKA83DRAFT_1436002 [Pisolithus microcarpus]
MDILMGLLFFLPGLCGPISWRHRRCTSVPSWKRSRACYGHMCTPWKQTHRVSMLRRCGCSLSAATVVPLWIDAIYIRVFGVSPSRSQCGPPTRTVCPRRT